MKLFYCRRPKQPRRYSRPWRCPPAGYFVFSFRVHRGLGGSPQALGDSRGFHLGRVGRVLGRVFFREVGLWNQRLASTDFLPHACCSGGCRGASAFRRVEACNGAPWATPAGWDRIRLARSEFACRAGALPQPRALVAQPATALASLVMRDLVSATRQTRIGGAAFFCRASRSAARRCLAPTVWA